MSNQKFFAGLSTQTLQIIRQELIKDRNLENFAEINVYLADIAIELISREVSLI